MKTFDYFIAIDWSARSSPSSPHPEKNAIWLAEGGVHTQIKDVYFRTRKACIDYLENRLITLIQEGKRVIVGWDFVFGYPKGLARALRLRKKPAWHAIWHLLNEMVVDNDDNSNNRFKVGAELNRRINIGTGPFWGVPRGQSGIFLGSKKDFRFPVFNRRVSLAERRHVETRVRRMQPGWKLAYTGSVGGQAIVGIPYLFRLCFEHEYLQHHSWVWPFQTEFEALIPNSPCILHAEIYPSGISYSTEDEISDRAQVRAYVSWLIEQVKHDDLDKWLSCPPHLSRRHRKDVLHHEGWVLGIS